ncbi:beta-glucosidase-like protein 1 [Elsinoe australis]|uniref:Beta-glucosidase-like protein 1 n=1 Tax=Elsinoe australis TaxID=40998 RepID=A0A4U7B9K6_9PEZI|nr:beta-glucosidase-like protein 1 [Elsinoe australis]
MAKKIAQLLFGVGLVALTTAQGYQNASMTSSGYMTTTSNSTLTTTVALNVDDLWDLLVGPASSAATTTTVSPTPVPSQDLIPPPPLHYPSYPSGQQIIPETKNESWSFPKDFWWGVASAAFQVEGAVRDEGRGPSNWDRLTRVPGYISDNNTADIGDNNYYLYKQDIARLAALGVKAYSFSLSWSRILPFGRGPINQQGIDHYNDVINTCIQYGLIPQVTLYHWDTPLYLEDLYGGWLSEQIVPDFVDYARIAYQAFGDRVKYWFTVNEPIVFCSRYPYPAQYFKNFTIPTKQAPFHCGQSVLLAHSQAYHLGKSLVPDSIISYKNNGGYKIPLTNSTEDAQAVERAWNFNEGWFSDPIFLTGDYNANVKSYVSTFLRPFTSSEQELILGSADYYAHDAYTSQFYFAPDAGIPSCLANASDPLFPTCANTSYTYAPSSGGWLIGPAADPTAPWLHKATDWVPAFLHYLQDTWITASPTNASGVAVTEFGFAEPFENSKTLRQDILTDPLRTSYFHDYMRALLLAMSEGVEVIGTLAWSFVDNYEWQTGYQGRFGLQYVNFSDPARPRYYKASFFEYVNAFEVYQEK